MLKFHLDEHVDHAIARGLRDRGIDVTTTTDAGLLSEPDEAHLQLARSQGRVVFTYDPDFLRLASLDQEHAGIVFCAAGARTVGYLVRTLCFMSDCLSPEDMTGKVEYL